MTGPLSTLVVLPTRDRRELLADALASVAAQSQLPDAVVVSDAGDQGPLDPPAALVPRLKHLTGGAPGIGRQRNAAVASARGDLIAFLDDDDRWRPDHLAGLVEAFRDPSVGFAYRDVAVIRERLEGGHRVALETRVIACDWNLDLMRTHDYIAPSAWCVRRVLFDSLGGFDAEFHYSDDWDFLMRLSARTTPHRVPGIGAEVRMREGGNASHEAGDRRLADLRRLEQRYGLGPIAPLTFWEVAEVVARTAPVA